ncbi:hypothetical protein [Clostridium sp. M14]|uniref:hypothetical protein n=1 Tax=Clostridium sp. M14 TaxID=2716311 RepID=UPI0013EE6258|nr:hypothetical protein [Clostridium sp. M14]MBZ9693394.1 hypothetical protein [Clostridium sp. M14]
MITDRDKEIINFIDKIGFATIKNITDMYFTNNRYGYDSARKRLKKISEMGEYIKYFKNSETNELVYIPYESKLKRVSIHNIKVLEYLCDLKVLGCDIKEIELEPVFDSIKPDVYVCFEFNKFLYSQLVEVQIRHDYVDLKRFKKPEVIKSIYEKMKDVSPRIIIIQDTNKDYEKDNDTEFKIIQLYTDLRDVAKVLC